MADEIKLQVGITVTNVDFKQTFQPGTISIDQAAQGMHAPVVTVGTTEEVLATGDIGTLGVIVGRNLDATNYVTVGPSTGAAKHDFIRIEAGEPFAFRLEPGITWRWNANTAPVKVQIQLYED